MMARSPFKGPTFFRGSSSIFLGTARSTLRSKFVPVLITPSHSPVAQGTAQYTEPARFPPSVAGSPFSAISRRTNLGTPFVLCRVKLGTA
jgi:hypothetical protein